MLGQQARGGGHDAFGVSGIGHGAAHGIQHRQAAVEEHGGGGFGDGIQHPDNLALGIADRAVAKGEIGLFEASAALDQQGEILDIGGMPFKRRIGDGAHVGPDFTPHLAEWTTQCRRFVAQDRNECVVVQRGQVRPPND